MRLSRSLLAASVAVATDFEVTSCENTSTNAAEMTISIDQAYMDLHHPTLTSDGFNLVGGNYIKVIGGNDLTLNMTDSTFVYLEHSLVTADEAVPDSNVIFPGRTTTFKCKYPRAVNVGDSYTLPPNVDPSPYVGDGTLHYNFDSVVSNGRTILTIAPTHGITSLEANVQNCAVSFQNMPTVYPVRNQASWGDSDVCIDNRMLTTFNYANGGAVVDWRTFHFNDPNGVANSQTHGITCEIHVSDTLSVSAPSACSCTTGQQECRDIVDGVIYRHDAPIDLETDPGTQRTIATGISMPIEYELRLEMNLARIHPNLYRTMISFKEDGSSDSDCGNSIPKIYYSSGDRSGMNELRFVIMNCHNGTPNRYIYRDLMAVDVVNQWVQIKTGQRYEANGDFVWYLKVGPDAAPLTEWTTPQSHRQAYPNVNFLVGWFDADSYIRNITITDTVAANANG